jgi:hypothetical protein
MGHFGEVLKKVKDKINEFKYPKKNDNIKYKVESKILEKTNYKKIVNLDGEVEDWYHDVS